MTAGRDFADDLEALLLDPHFAQLRAQAVHHLTPRPSGGVAGLRHDRAHARAMAANPDSTDADRALWIQLADELDRRLNEPGAHPDPHPALFEETS